MPINNPYLESKRIAIESMSKEDVVVKLFEEASKQIKLGILLIQKKDFAKSYNAIAKAQKIISSLSRSLNMDVSISAELKDMYNFIFDQLSQANVNRDLELLEKLWKLVNELKDAFKKAQKINNGLS